MPLPAFQSTFLPVSPCQGLKLLVLWTMGERRRPSRGYKTAHHIIYWPMQPISLSLMWNKERKSRISRFPGRLWSPNPPLLLLLARKRKVMLHFRIHHTASNRFPRGAMPTLSALSQHDEVCFRRLWEAKPKGSLVGWEPGTPNPLPETWHIQIGKVKSWRGHWRPRALRQKEGIRTASTTKRQGRQQMTPCHYSETIIPQFPTQ